MNSFELREHLLCVVDYLTLDLLQILRVDDFGKFECIVLEFDLLQELDDAFIELGLVLADQNLLELKRHLIDLLLLFGLECLVLGHVGVVGRFDVALDAVEEVFRLVDDADQLRNFLL